MIAKQIKKEKRKKHAATTKSIIQSRDISVSQKQIITIMYKYFIACHVSDIQFLIKSNSDVDGAVVESQAAVGQWKCVQPVTAVG